MVFCRFPNQEPQSVNPAGSALSLPVSVRFVICPTLLIIPPPWSLRPVRTRLRRPLEFGINRGGTAVQLEKSGATPFFGGVPPKMGLALNGLVGSNHDRNRSLQSLHPACLDIFDFG